MQSINGIMSQSPVIPVLVIPDICKPARLAEALVSGGLSVLEVTMRTSGALDAIRSMKEVPGAIVGAGTVLNEAMLDAAVNAGADFIVSPGLTEPLAKAAIARNTPFLPGALFFQCASATAIGTQPPVGQYLLAAS